MTNLCDTEIKRKVNPRIYLYKWGYNQRTIGCFPLSQTDDIIGLSTLLLVNTISIMDLCKFFLSTFS